MQVKKSQPKSRKQQTYDFKVKPLNIVDLTFKFKEKSTDSTETWNSSVKEAIVVTCIYLKKKKFLI